jgi:hypothetical protein
VDKVFGDGFNALAGKDITIIGTLIGILFVWFMLKVGAPAEVAIPAAVLFIVGLSFYAGVIPQALFTAALLVAAVLIALAFNKVFRQ